MATILKLSWQDVLYPHAHIGHIDKMREIAKILGYRFFAWNGLVYETETWKCTNLRAESVSTSDLSAELCFFVAYERHAGPSFRVLNIQHDLDTKDGLLAFLEWFEKEIGEPFVLKFWRNLKT